MASQPGDIDHSSGSGESKTPADQYSEEEAARRRDAVLKIMVNTPPHPRVRSELGCVLMLTSTTVLLVPASAWGCFRYWVDL